jgi:hypothetical protein
LIALVIFLLIVVTTIQTTTMRIRVRIIGAFFLTIY